MHVNSSIRFFIAVTVLSLTFADLLKRPVNRDLQHKGKPQPSEYSPTAKRLQSLGDLAINGPMAASLAVAGLTGVAFVTLMVPFVFSALNVGGRRNDGDELFDRIWERQDSSSGYDSRSKGNIFLNKLQAYLDEMNSNE